MRLSSIKNIFGPIIVTAVVLLALEGVSRLILSHIYNRRFDSSLIEEHKYGITSGLKPNASGMVWGKAFHTDEMGARRQTKKKTAKHKVLIIGDSVTEGVGVDDSLTFADIINNWSDTSDVRNISLIGWSTSDYRNALSHILPSDTTVRSVILFYCFNDIYGRVKTKDMPLMANKGILSAINASLQDRCATYKLIKLLAYKNSDRYYQYDKMFYKDNAMVSCALADMVSINDLCKARNVHFEVMILPYRSQLNHTKEKHDQWALEDRFGDYHIQFFELAKAMENYSINRPDFTPDALYLFGDEIHLSAKGHYAVADIVGGQ